MNYIAKKATVKVVKEWVDSDGVARQLVSIKARCKPIGSDYDLALWKIRNDSKGDKI
jgi:hypothetical protein